MACATHVESSTSSAPHRPQLSRGPTVAHASRRAPPVHDGAPSSLALPKLALALAFACVALARAPSAWAEPIDYQAFGFGVSLHAGVAVVDDAFGTDGDTRSYLRSYTEHAPYDTLGGSQLLGERLTQRRAPHGLVLRARGWGLELTLAASLEYLEQRVEGRLQGGRANDGPATFGGDVYGFRDIVVGLGYTLPIRFAGRLYAAVAYGFDQGVSSSSFDHFVASSNLQDALHMRVGLELREIELWLFHSDLHVVHSFANPLTGRQSGLLFQLTVGARARIVEPVSLGLALAFLHRDPHEDTAAVFGFADDGPSRVLLSARPEVRFHLMDGFDVSLTGGLEDEVAAIGLPLWGAHVPRTIGATFRVDYDLSF